MTTTGLLTEPIGRPVAVAVAVAVISPSYLLSVGFRRWKHGSARRSTTLRAVGQERPPIAVRFARPSVMGIVNVTPDSFSDGGVAYEPGAAVARARRLIGEGAAIVDVGGESTRPGAAPVSLAEEL